MRTAFTPLLCLAAAGIAAGQTTFTDTFENGVNAGGWRIGGPDERFESTGGNPGWYLRSSGLDTAIVHTVSNDQIPSPFMGNYRARNVTRAGIDAIVHHVDFSAAERPMTIMLWNNRGTPGNIFDDIGVYLVGPNIPTPGEGWRHFEFTIPSQSAGLPGGWIATEFGSSGMSDDQIWNTVIQDVSYILWYWHDPEYFAIFQMWDVGVDNISITEGSSCYANCDGSTTAPVLNVLDFTCFLNKFAAGDAYANCDGSTVPPVLNVLDFTCFLNRFAAGCP
jgi:hypothetical protein